MLLFGEEDSEFLIRWFFNRFRRISHLEFSEITCGKPVFTFQRCLDWLIGQNDTDVSRQFVLQTPELLVSLAATFLLRLVHFVDSWKSLSHIHGWSSRTVKKNRLTNYFLLKRNGKKSRLIINAFEFVYTCKQQYWQTALWSYYISCIIPLKKNKK